MAKRKRFETVDEYLSSVPSDARRILEGIRKTVKLAIPDATEVISYQLPAFKKKRTFFYYGAFKDHIGIYPPVTADADLAKALTPFRGPKGNLKLPMDAAIEPEIIARVAEALYDQYEGAAE